MARQSHTVAAVRPVQIGDVVLELEPPEAGRYHAPILLIPGLFQSTACWRPFTTMLAHRGWEVYALPRQSHETDDDAPPLPPDYDWSGTIAAAKRAAKKLGDKVIVFGADVGAAVALAIAEEIRPLALALFAPAEPAHVGASVNEQTGFFERRRRARSSGPVPPPARIAKSAPLPTSAGDEPRALVADLVSGIPYDRPTAGPPTIVFAASDDALVSTEHTESFAGAAHARLARTRVAGRWWPTSGWQSPCDEAHRFLILTLGDRVVEFPEEILAE
jgi:pimeloyl-ACP methyl ester carboxylesterase